MYNNKNDLSDTKLDKKTSLSCMLPCDKPPVHCIECARIWGLCPIL